MEYISFGEEMPLACFRIPGILDLLLTPLFLWHYKRMQGLIPSVRGGFRGKGIDQDKTLFPQRALCSVPYATRHHSYNWIPD